MCTAIGCMSAVTFALDDGTLVGGETYDVDLCVAQACSSVRIGLPAAETGSGEVGNLVDGVEVHVAPDTVTYTIPDLGGDAPVDVSLVVANIDGELVVDFDQQDVPLTSNQPNGPDCPPVCFFGRVEV